ncbi:MAG: response regulator [Verrucomicrobiales bacterium]|nr:response regulator [Verrucomicrobiales bacterium]
MIQENLVLVCEHNHNDIVFFQYEWPRLPFPATLLILQTGSEALAFLRKRAETCSGGLRLVLCEMNLPHCSGLELLNYIKQTPALKHIPVIMTGLHFTPNDTKRAHSTAGKNLSPWVP